MGKELSGELHYTLIGFVFQDTSEKTVEHNGIKLSPSKPKENGGTCITEFPIFDQ